MAGALPLSTSVQLIHYTVTTSEGISIIDVLPEVTFQSALKCEQPQQQDLRQMRVPRSVYELALLTRYTECRIKETDAVETFRNWDDIREARSHRESLDKVGTKDEDVDEDEDEETDLRESLAFILPPFYFRHQGCSPARVEADLRHAAHVWEADPDFTRVAWRVNNDIVAQFLSSNEGRECLISPDTYAVTTLISACSQIQRKYCAILRVLVPEARLWLRAGCAAAGDSVASATDDIVIALSGGAVDCGEMDRSFLGDGGFAGKGESGFEDPVLTMLRAIAIIEARHSNSNIALLFRTANSGGTEFDDTLSWTISNSQHRPQQQQQQQQQQLMLQHRSISFGASVFAGALFDSTASVWHLHRSNVDVRRRLRVLRVEITDPRQSGMLYLPKMLHPITQLAAIGELFHPRTKCFVAGTSDDMTLAKNDTAVVAGLHHTSVAELPYCLRADPGRYASAADMQTAWNEIAGGWALVTDAARDVIVAGPPSVSAHQIFAGSMCLRRNWGWGERIAECHRAGITLPSTSPRDIGIAWLHRHWQLYERLAARLPRGRKHPFELLSREASGNLVECLRGVNGSGDTGLVMSILAAVALEPHCRLQLLHEAFGLRETARTSRRWTTLRVGSLNINGYPNSAQMKALLSHIKGACLDVLALQECPLQVAREIAREVCLSHVHTSPADYLNNAILSRLPLHDCESITLPPSKEVSRKFGASERHEKRSAVVSTLYVAVHENCIRKGERHGSDETTQAHEEVPVTVPVTVVATHLCHLREGNRVWQMNALLAHPRLKRSPGAKILMGDFNAVTRSDFDEISWAENAAARLDYGLEEVKTNLSRRLQERGCVDAATGLILGSPTTAHCLDIEGTSRVDTRVDYILTCHREPSRISPQGVDSQQHQALYPVIVPVPATYTAVETGGTDHKLICASMYVLL